MPVIFLAGPIQGAVPWQETAIEILRCRGLAMSIACPRRPQLHKERFGPVEYEAQVDWETHYLRQAGKAGVVMFWLAKESIHKCERAYAQTSRFELGEWKMRHELDGARLVLGIEPGFTNERYIRRRFSQDCPDIAICDSLEATCLAVTNLFR